MKKHPLAILVCLCVTNLLQAQSKPNILIIMGDDIGWFNTSCYNQGMMGYMTPKH